MALKERLLLGVGVFILGIGLGFYIGELRYGAAFEGSLQIRSNDGGLTNPLLECEIARGVIDAPKARFSKELADYIETIKKTYTGLEVAVYYRDLNNGPTASYNGNTPFIPASLLKAPLAMAVLKRAEIEPEFLSQEVLFEGSTPLAQRYSFATPLKPGNRYTIEDLLVRMVTESDNQSAILLRQNITDESFSTLSRILGIEYANLDASLEEVSANEISGVFRTLYNSSYLSRENSEKLLGYFAKSSFDKGLRAGVPENIIVAHKFGERGTSVSEQLHDCGIIYYPNHPYLLCVMTSGHSLYELEQAISQISAFTYKKVDGFYSTDTVNSWFSM
jgi:beta-lactamase class A